MTQLNELFQIIDKSLENSILFHIEKILNLIPLHLDYRWRIILPLLLKSTKHTMFRCAYTVYVRPRKNTPFSLEFPFCETMIWCHWMSLIQSICYASLLTDIFLKLFESIWIVFRSQKCFFIPIRVYLVFVRFIFALNIIVSKGKKSRFLFLDRRIIFFSWHFLDHHFRRCRIVVVVLNQHKILIRVNYLAHHYIKQLERKDDNVMPKFYHRTSKNCLLFYVIKPNKNAKTKHDSRRGKNLCWLIRFTVNSINAPINKFDNDLFLFWCDGVHEKWDCVNKIHQILDEMSA